MKRFCTWLLGFAMLIFSVNEVDAQVASGGQYDPDSPERRGQSGLTFIQIGASARGEALGGAFNGAHGDPSTIFYNPAGMAGIQGYGLYLNQTAWLADITVNSISAATNLGWGVVGLTLQAVDYGTIIGTRITSLTENPLGYETTGKLEPSANVLGAFMAAQVTDKFSFGVHVKRATQDLGTYPVWKWPVLLGEEGNYLTDPIQREVSAWLVDFGTQYDTGSRSFRINMSFQNFGTPKRFINTEFDPPLTYRLGVSGEAIELFTGSSSPVHSLNLFIDGVDNRDVLLDAALGAEYVVDLSNMMPGLSAALRLGRRPSRNQDGTLSTGGGLVLPVGPTTVQLDYSYSDYGPQLTAQRFGLTILFE